MRKSGQTVLFFPRFQSEIIFITHQRRGDKSPTFWHANEYCTVPQMISDRKGSCFLQITTAPRHQRQRATWQGKWTILFIWLILSDIVIRFLHRCEEMLTYFTDLRCIDVLLSFYRVQIKIWSSPDTIWWHSRIKKPYRPVNQYDVKDVMNVLGRTNVNDF